MLISGQLHSGDLEDDSDSARQRSPSEEVAARILEGGSTMQRVVLERASSEISNLTNNLNLASLFPTVNSLGTIRTTLSSAQSKVLL